MAIQSFDFSTGKTKDPLRLQSILFLREAQDSDTIADLLRKGRHPMLGRPDNLRDALELARKHKKGVLYLDADWEGVNVPEVLQDINRRFPDFSVVVAKSSATKEELMELQKQGAAGFVLKPVNAEAVAKIIQRL